MSTQSKEFETYRHFRRDKGAVTACCSVLPDERKMFVGFACCNPLDLGRFNRKKGRITAQGRLKGRGIEIALKEPEEFTTKKGETKFKLGIAAALIEFMKNFDEHNMGMREYHSECKPGDLKKWFPEFLAEL